MWACLATAVMLLISIVPSGDRVATKVSLLLWMGVVVVISVRSGVDRGSVRVTLPLGLGVVR